MEHNIFTAYHHCEQYLARDSLFNGDNKIYSDFFSMLMNMCEHIVHSSTFVVDNANIGALLNEISPKFIEMEPEALMRCCISLSLSTTFTNISQSKLKP